MRKNNKWQSGHVQLIVPPLPTVYKGQSGILFQEGAFDSGTGLEYYLVLLDQPVFLEALANIRSVDLNCTSGLARTSQGPVIFLVWQVAPGSPHETTYEQFLNPHEMGAIRALSAAGQQTHLKLVIVDCISGQAVNWFEFENTYGLGDLAAGAAQTIGHEPQGDFQLAQAEFTERYSLDQLLGK